MRFTYGALRKRASSVALGGLLMIAASAASLAQGPQRNIIIFVADGLRPGSVNPADAPTLYSIRQKGVYFANSHSLFPTFTTPNASAIATGHYLGDTGDFSNTIYSGYPVFAPQSTTPGGPTTNLASGTTTPFLESNPVLGDIDEHFGGNYLTEETLLAYARQNGYSTAAVGKVGPVLIQDVTQGNLVAGVAPIPTTVIIDDSTGRAGGVPVPADIATAIANAGLPTQAPNRTNGASSTSQQSNGFSGNNTTPGTLTANVVQQQYFADTVTRAILPTFKTNGKPFVVLFWSRDPDGTQHNQGDSLNSLVPGINGPTSRAAVKNADNNLAQILAYINSDPALANNTDVFVTADHGFGTISKHNLDTQGHFTGSYAAAFTYVDSAGRQEVNTGYLPVGFVAIDLAHALNLPLYDPDAQVGAGAAAAYKPVDPTRPQATAAVSQHPASGDGVIGGTGRINPVTDGKVIVAANGGSDLIYVPDNDAATVRTIVDFLSRQDYVSGIFVNDRFGAIPGALPTSAINLNGSTSLPMPTLVVNFRTFSTDPSNPFQTGVVVADSGLQQGQGMHGSFGRHDTFNNMTALGPDFKRGFADSLPVSNADVQVTLASILGFQIPRQGSLIGRVLTEALVGHPDTAPYSVGTLRSLPAANGQRTYLKYQQLGTTKYFDVAGFMGRSVGL